MMPIDNDGERRRGRDGLEGWGNSHRFLAIRQWSCDASRCLTALLPPERMDDPTSALMWPRTSAALVSSRAKSACSTSIDEFTHECLAIRSRRLRSIDVISDLFILR